MKSHLVEMLNKAIIIVIIIIIDIIINIITIKSQLKTTKTNNQENVLFHDFFVLLFYVICVRNTKLMPILVLLRFSQTCELYTSKAVLWSVFTHVARICANLSEQKKFFYISMATVVSCEYTLQSSQLRFPLPSVIITITSKGS